MERTLPFLLNPRRRTQAGKVYIAVQMEKAGPLFAWSGPHTFQHEQQAALDAVPLRPWERPTELVPLPRRCPRPRPYHRLVTVEDWEEERERRKRVGAKVAREGK